MLRRLFFCIVPVILLFASSAEGRPLQVNEVPDPLKPWVDWVLFDEEGFHCPAVFNDGDFRRCAWPSRLSLSLDEKGGTFRQKWQVYEESWILLPGDSLHWPEEVSIDQEGATVTNRWGFPYLRVKKGRHFVTGRFSWSRLPESLYVPPESGLIGLSISGSDFKTPLIRDSRLWLRESAGPGRKGSEDQIEYRTFRKITDKVPLKLTTRLDMDISGSPREILIGPVLLQGFIPVSLSSSLPARLEPDGRLRMQVRAGRWSVGLEARSRDAVTELTLGSGKVEWNKDEVWVFEARPELRLVEISGVPAIDPRQTTLPEEWRSLPAYRIKSGETFTMTVKRRGDEDPSPNRLALSRSLFLDFDGKGYTVEDRIGGIMTRGWRLEMDGSFKLGRVLVDGNARMVTVRPGSGREGVEIRTGTVDLTANSRYKGKRGNVPAVGWDTDVNMLSADLNLPPGWRLFYAGGVDSAPHWINGWSLLDLFMVMITVLAARRLFGTRWAIAALAALALSWQEPDAPQYAWLSLLAAVALLRVIPEGRFKGFVKMYRNLAVLALVLVSVPFIINSVRNAIYPQLEGYWSPAPEELGITISGNAVMPEVQEPEAEAPFADTLMEKKEKMMEDEGDLERKPVLHGYSGGALVSSYSQISLDSIDATANIQTGPGIPRPPWSNSIALSWNGPVGRGQELSLWLIPPFLNMLMHFAYVLLIAVFAFRLIIADFPVKGRLARFVSAGSMFLAALILSTLLGPSHAAAKEAPLPPDEIPGTLEKMLGTLKERLTRPEECYPDCAQVPRMRIELGGETISIRAEYHMSAESSAPVPAGADQWWPSTVAVDGSEAHAMARDENGLLWISLPRGIHQVMMKGPAGNGGSFSLPLPLKPFHLEIKSDGWKVEGLDADGNPGDVIHFFRKKGTAGAGGKNGLESDALPGFFIVERILQLGLEWRTVNTATRISPPGPPELLEVPLLAGESVTTEGITVKDGKAMIQMGPGSESLRWTSVLEKKEELVLTAPDMATWAEKWMLDIGQDWHVETEGIPGVHREDPGARWFPEFRPWPGEALRLMISRPGSAPGRTLTVDRSSIAMTPGIRSSSVNLELDLRSSQGGQHDIRIPAEAELQDVSIDGRAQPIRAEQGSVTLPLVPGREHVELSWRQEGGMPFRLVSPEVNLQTESVNAYTTVKPPRNRWVLLAGGPKLGPAVLFWGVLLVIIIAGLVFGMTGLTPLKSHDWILLGIGFTQSSTWAALVVVGWFLAMDRRGRTGQEMSNRVFNLMQVGLGLLTILALGLLFITIQQGLLGTPDMQIAGNSSSAHILNWYQDRTGDILPRAWIVSVPLFVYRLLMLAWSLWLAFAVVKWSGWGWKNFSSNGIWRRLDIRLSPARKRKEPEKHEGGGQAEEEKGK